MNNDTGMDDPLGDPTFDAALNIHQFLRNDRVSLADTEPPPAVPIDIDPMFPQDVLERVPIYATPARDPSSAPVNHVNGTVHLSALNKEQDSSEESGDLNLATKMEIEFNPLPRSSLSTGLCYDVRMRFHHELRQHGDVHPEDPRRIWAIYTELCEAGLVADTLAPGPPKKDLLARIPARHASIEEICLVHTRAHYDFVDDTRNMSQEDLIELDQGDSIYFNRSSYLCAILSAGGAIETCRAVAAGLVKNAIAVIRPPGHHAEESRAMGFCLFDNVAIAARVCQADFGENCRKILILDW
ncbi:MAG: Histone deacetylase hda1 [Pycnora praestabilis]|nr:MAG: Histone deacetylase hda1 [Pycnora praestabilis]